MSDTPSFPQPLDGTRTPRFAGLSTFMRLPHEPDPAKLDIAIVGVPWDGGTTNRPGARHGPRELRAYAPGTGTPEIGGYSTAQALQMIRGLQGLSLIGADVVEVSPPFDLTGNTALVGATMMFELLCILSEALHSRRSR